MNKVNKKHAHWETTVKWWLCAYDSFMNTELTSVSHPRWRELEIEIFFVCINFN